MKDVSNHLLGKMSDEADEKRRKQLMQDYELIHTLHDHYFDDLTSLTESVGSSSDSTEQNLIHKESNAVAVYVVEGMGYDQFGDPIRVQLTRREIHELDVRTKNGRQLLEGLVQLNRKVITDDMSKKQFLGPTTSYAYTEIVPVVRRRDGDA